MVTTWSVFSHCVKSVQIRSFFWSIFYRIRTEYGETLRISLYSFGKIRTRKYSVFGHFSRSVIVKLCDKSICKPLNIIFKSCLTQGIFPSEWKKANVSIRKKKKKKKKNENKKTLSNPVLKTTDLPLFSRSLAKFSKKRFPYFFGKNLISENQSGFKPGGDSCVNQCLAITHEVFSSFDDHCEVRGIHWHFRRFR